MKKHICSLLLVFFIICNCFIPTVFADDKEYSIDSVDFCVQLNEDGSADIIETWQVNYKKGEFSRFYKNIYLDVPLDEKFSIHFNAVTVNGQQCEYTDDTESRKDYTYSLIDEGYRLRYEIYAQSENEVKEYQIKYTLHDVVKYVDNEFYWFEYRFLPYGFEQNISTLTIHIDTPGDGLNLKLVDLTKGETTTEQSRVSIATTNVSDLYKVELKMTGSGFATLESSCLDSDDLDGYMDDADMFITVLILVGVIAVIGISVSVYESRKTKKLEQYLKDNPNMLRNIYNKWVPTHFTAAEFAANVSHNFYLSYLVYLADLADKKIIKLGDDYEYIEYPSNYDYKNYQDEILKLLDGCRERAKRKGFETELVDGKWILPTSYLEIYFAKAKTYNDIKKTLLSISRKSAIKDNEFIKDRDDLRFALRTMNKNKELPLVELSDIINNYKSLDLRVLHYCFQREHRYNQSDVANDIKRDNSAFMTMAAVNCFIKFNSSSDSGSSCSSCGSCGGCGGCGGAD